MHKINAVIHVKLLFIALATFETISYDFQIYIYITA